MTDSEPNYEGRSDGNGHVRARYQFSDAKMEVEGPVEFVNQHTMLFLSILKNDPELAESNRLVQTSDTPLLTDSGVSKTPSNIGSQKPVDLIQFYHKLDPKGQNDQILIITYYFQKYEDYECVALEDYEKAYKLLLRLAVKSPKNLDSSVRAVCNRTDFLYVRSAEFKLTIPGEEYVENMIQAAA